MLPIVLMYSPEPFRSIKLSPKKRWHLCLTAIPQFLDQCYLRNGVANLFKYLHP